MKLSKVYFEGFNAACVQSIPAVVGGVSCGDSEAVARALGDISKSLQDMTDALKQMHGRDLQLLCHLS